MKEILFIFGMMLFQRKKEKTVDYIVFSNSSLMKFVSHLDSLEDSKTFGAYTHNPIFNSDNTVTKFCVTIKGASTFHESIKLYLKHNNIYYTQKDSLKKL